MSCEGVCPLASMGKYASALVPLPGVGNVPLEQIADMATNPTGSVRLITALNVSVMLGYSCTRLLRDSGGTRPYRPVKTVCAATPYGARLGSAIATFE